MEDDGASRKEKKRKRRLNAETESSPKVVKEMDGKEEGKKKKKKKERLVVDVECLGEVSDKVAPFVGFFPSGFDPQRCRNPSGEGDGRENATIKAFKSKISANSYQLVVSPQGTKVDFVGTSTTGEASAPQVCTYALGILDKETLSLKMVPIVANKIFRLDPKLRGTPGPIGEPEEEVVMETKYAQVRGLSKLYGTKKDKNMVCRYEAMHYTDDPEASKEIGSKLGVLEADKESMADVVTHVERNLPFYDLTATSPEKAYPLERIILNSEWDYLSDILELLESKPDAASSVNFWEQNNYPVFICNRVPKLQEMEDDDEKKKLASILSYICYLIAFKNLPYRIMKQSTSGRSGSYKFHGMPVILFQKFAQMFVVQEVDRPPQEKTDLLISHILVLTLFADRFNTITTDIASDLKIAPIELRPHYAKLGCKISPVKKAHNVILPVPLKFPELRQRGRRRT